MEGFRDPNGNVPTSSAIYYLTTTALDAGNTLALLNIDQSTPNVFPSQSDTESFAPQQQITVEARLWVQDRVKMDTFVLDFNVISVPEPTSGLVAAALLAIYILRIRVSGPKRLRLVAI